MLAALLQGGSQAEQGLFIIAVRGSDAHQLGLALGEGAGLIHHQGVHLTHDLDGLGVLEQHPHGGAFACGHHDGHGRGQTQGAGAGDDEHGHRVDDGVGHAGLGTDEGPDDEGEDRDPHHRGHEIGGHHVHQLLDGGPAALGFGHHFDDLGQESVGAHLFGPHHQGTGTVHRGADDLAVRLLFHRDGLAGDHGLVHRTLALQDHAIHRHLFPGPHP